MSYKNTIFTGVGTALITPFKNGKIDYFSLERLIEFQIQGGASAIILLGTTGEASTICEKERCKMIAFANEKIKNRVPLIVGCGTNNTEVSIRYSKKAKELGSSAVLLVTPYYNKTTKEGIIKHYEKIASAVSLPIILYNVPSRTGFNIPVSAYRELSQIDNIVALKEASGSLSYLVEILDTCGENLDIYSGNDELTLPFLSLGGKGVISVCSNAFPSYMARLCKAFFNNDLPLARKMQIELTPLVKQMFAEVNPIPIKYACSYLDLCQNELRLPLCQSTKEAEIAPVLEHFKSL